MGKELTDREKESDIFIMQDKHRALAKDGWMRIQDGKAAFVKDGAYLDIKGNKIAPEKPSKPVSKVVKPVKAEKSE